MKGQWNARITLWANRAVAAILAVLLFVLQPFLQWYYSALEYTPPWRDHVGVLVAFYCSAAVIAVALWNLEKLMQNILAQRIFIRENVRRIRRVQWCCGIVALICLVGTLFVIPLILFAAIMGFLCLVVSVVVSTMDAAVTIREENDLTI